MAKREKKTIISGVTRETADEAFASYAMAEAQAAKITADMSCNVQKFVRSMRISSPSWRVKRLLRLTPCRHTQARTKPICL